MRSPLLVLALFLSGGFSLGAGTGCGDNIEEGGTIGDHVRATARLSSLEDALADTNLLEVLDGPGPYTLFAFANGDFEPGDLPTEQLQSLAEYHIHEGLISESDLLRRTAASTLEGTEIHIRSTLDGIVLNDGSNIESTSIVADNGVIHIIDRALSRTLYTENITLQNQTPLPVNGFVRDTIYTQENGKIHDLRVFIDMSSQHAGNVTLYLRHLESGRTVVLKQQSNSIASDIRTTFADGAVADIATDGIETEGEQAFPLDTYRPFRPLESFLGVDVAGSWELTVLNFGSESETDEVLSWGLTITQGDEMPAPALVFDPRRTVPPAMSQTFTEVATVAALRVGGLTGDIELTGSVGEFEAPASTIPSDRVVGALLFRIPSDAAPETAAVTIAARAGEVSRVVHFETTIAAPSTNGMRLAAHLSLPELGAIDQTGSDIWGWTDPITGAEIALMTTSNSTAFVDVSTPSQPTLLGYLPTQTKRALWRDVKVYGDHAYIVSEAFEHGMQIFDLTELRTSAPGQRFSATAHVADFGSAHNIAINEDSGVAYVVGSDFSGCDGGMLVYDLTVPIAPVAISCFSGAVNNTQAGGPSYPTDVYTHDVQCVTYSGPDDDYSGREICFSSDEQSIGIADFSDLASPTQIVRETYDGVGYTHQGWLTEDQRYFIVNDEFDELTLEVPTRSYVWDVSDLDNPVLLQSIDNPTESIGHNTYIHGGIAYQANYTSGLRLVDVSNLGSEMSEVAYFDTNPNDDIGCSSDDRCNSRAFDGAWSNYPFFESGTIIVSDTLRGLFVLEREL